MSVKVMALEYNEAGFLMSQLGIEANYIAGLSSFIAQFGGKASSLVGDKQLSFATQLALGIERFNVIHALVSEMGIIPISENLHNHKLHKAHVLYNLELAKAQYRAVIKRETDKYATKPASKKKEKSKKDSTSINKK